MKDVNEILKWLKNGEKIRPVNRTFKIMTTAPTIKLSYTDGSSKSSDFSPSSDYFGAGWVEVKRDLSKELSEVRIVGYGSDKTYEVDYIYFNPQCNRTLCRLIDGGTCDFPFDLTDFFYNEFEKVTEDEVLELSMEDLKLHFGQPVRIID